MKVLIVASVLTTLIVGSPCWAVDTSRTPPKALVLPVEVDMDAARTFIRIGFGLDQSARFESDLMLTPEMRTVQVQALIRMVKSYNSFEGERVADALTAFRGQVSGIQFGREGSPVLYISLPYWTHQREEVDLTGPHERIAEAATQALVERMRKVFVDQLEADEFSVEQHRVRVWWD